MRKAKLKRPRVKRPDPTLRWQILCPANAQYASSLELKPLRGQTAPNAGRLAHCFIPGMARRPCERIRKVYVRRRRQGDRAIETPFLHGYFKGIRQNDQFDGKGSKVAEQVVIDGWGPSVPMARATLVRF